MALARLSGMPVGRVRELVVVGRMPPGGVPAVERSIEIDGEGLELSIEGNAELIESDKRLKLDRLSEARPRSGDERTGRLVLTLRAVVGMLTEGRLVDGSPTLVSKLVLCRSPADRLPVGRGTEGVGIPDDMLMAGTIVDGSVKLKSVGTAGVGIETSGTSVDKETLGVLMLVSMNTDTDTEGSDTDGIEIGGSDVSMLVDGGNPVGREIEGVLIETPPLVFGSETETPPVGSETEPKEVVGAGTLGSDVITGSVMIESGLDTE